MLAPLALLTLLARASAWGAPPSGAVVFYRHGDRTPVDPYPTDPYRDPKLWPVPFGELTPRGMAQHYRLGGELRKRYQHILSDKFDPTNIYVRSTDIDRTLMSAQANLAGMFPVKPEDEFANDLPWLPVPVHTMPNEMDDVLAMAAPCPRFDLEKKKLLESEFFKYFLKNHTGLFRYVEVHTKRSMPDLAQLSYIYDVLFIEELYNFTLPNWTKPVYPDQLLEATKWSFMIDTYTPLLARLKIGPLAKLATKNLMAMHTGEVTQKLFIYSTHDTTIASMLNALGLASFTVPAYASTLIFELVSDNNSEGPYVRVLYDMVELNNSRCGNPCSLTNWSSTYADLFPDDHAAECSLDQNPSVNEYIVVYLLIFILGIVIVIVIVNTITCFILKKSNKIYNFEDFSKKIIP